MFSHLQLINDKKTLNHRIEQLVDERRALEERWRRAAQALEERYKLELRNQHDKMAAAQQVWLFCTLTNTLGPRVEYTRFNYAEILGHY